jgi:hypothetical protein
VNRLTPSFPHSYFIVMVVNGWLFGPPNTTGMRPARPLAAACPIALPGGKTAQRYRLIPRDNRGMMGMRTSALCARKSRYSHRRARTLPAPGRLRLGLSGHTLRDQLAVPVLHIFHPESIQALKHHPLQTTATPPSPSFSILCVPLIFTILFLLQSSFQPVPLCLVAEWTELQNALSVG